MNPRAFCREEGYETALILTYSFDPLFFERIVLRDLWTGGMNECVVVADQHALEDALVRAAGQVRYLGRRYRLITPLGDARQHAKLMLRSGPSGALVWVGSGNLTFGGWGDNKELATAWRIDPADRLAVALFAALVENIAPLLHGGAEQMAKKLLDLPWLSNSNRTAATDYGVLFSNKEETLSTQLARRWKGRQFHTIKVLTGSTDERGAFLEWAAHTFGVKKALIGLNPENSAFNLNMLKKLSMDIQIIPMPANPMPHAKFYYFEGKKDSAVIMGSANCSAAAWLAPLNAGGNTELAVVYDHCEPKQIGAILRILDKKAAVAIEDVFEATGKEKPPTEEKAAVRVLEFSAHGVTGDLRLVIAPSKKKIARVTAFLDDFEYELAAHDKDGCVFTGGRPDLMLKTSTHFARLVFELHDGSVYETLRWLDEENELAQSSLRRRILSIERLGASSTQSEQRQIINDIAEVARAIFSGKEFHEPDFARKTRKGDEDATPQAVDPHDLVRSIEQIPERHAGQHQVGQGNSLPIHGIMRLLFEDPRNPEIQDFDEDLFEEDETVIQPDNKAIKKERKTRKQEEPSETFKNRLEEQMEDFIEHAFSLKFLSDCTAMQFLQATVFPLAIAIRGKIGNWIDDSTAVDWVSRTLDKLLNIHISDENGDKYKGAIDLIQKRYAKQRRFAIAEDILGNGVLWSALVRVLTQLNWEETKGNLVRAFHLADIFDTPILYAHADSKAILNTVGAYWGGETAKRLLKEAAVTASHVKQLEECLAKGFPGLREQQRGCEHQGGDLVYNPKSGFGWVKETARIEAKRKIDIYLRHNGEVRCFMCDFYCNVYLAAKNTSEINRLLEKIKSPSNY